MQYAVPILYIGGTCQNMAKYAKKNLCISDQ